MGNCCSQNKDEKNALLISKKTCPHCNHVFNSEKKCKKHIKNCLYNKGDNNSFTHKSIYDIVYPI